MIPSLNRIEISVKGDTSILLGVKGLKTNNPHLIDYINFPEDEGCGYRLFCSGGISEDNPTDPEDNKDHFVMVIFRDYVAKVLNKTITKGEKKNIFISISVILIIVFFETLPEKTVRHRWLYYLFVYWFCLVLTFVMLHMLYSRKMLFIMIYYFFCSVCIVYLLDLFECCHIWLLQSWRGAGKKETLQIRFLFRRFLCHGW